MAFIRLAILSKSTSNYRMRRAVKTTDPTEFSDATIYIFLVRTLNAIE